MPNYKGTKTQSANMSIVTLGDGRQVCFSYGVIVAAFIPRDFADNSPLLGHRGSLGRADKVAKHSGYIRTDARYSTTTSKHMNQFAGNDSPIVPDAVLKALCAPLVSR